MRAFFVMAIFVMMSSVLIVFSELRSVQANSSAIYNMSVKFENLHFTTTSSSDNMRVVTATFTVHSGVESAGEIEIVIDGSQKVNNRLIIKQGTSDYSVDFLINYPKDQHLYSATAILTVNGTPADVIHREFGISGTALAGNGRSRQ